MLFPFQDGLDARVTIAVDTPSHPMHGTPCTGRAPAVQYTLGRYVTEHELSTNASTTSVMVIRRVVESCLMLYPADSFFIVVTVAGRGKTSSFFFYVATDGREATTSVA